MLHNCKSYQLAISFLKLQKAIKRNHTQFNWYLVKMFTGVLTELLQNSISSQFKVIGKEV